MLLKKIGKALSIAFAFVMAILAIVVTAGAVGAIATPTPCIMVGTMIGLVPGVSLILSRAVGLFPGECLNSAWMVPTGIVCGATTGAFFELFTSTLDDSFGVVVALVGASAIGLLVGTITCVALGISDEGETKT